MCWWSPRLPDPRVNHWRTFLTSSAPSRTRCWWPATGWAPASMGDLLRPLHHHRPWGDIHRGGRRRRRSSPGSIDYTKTREVRDLIHMFQDRSPLYGDTLLRPWTGLEPPKGACLSIFFSGRSCVRKLSHLSEFLQMSPASVEQPRVETAAAAFEFLAQDGRELMPISARRTAALSHQQERPGPCMRADIDALPLTEHTGAPSSPSKSRGSCGTPATPRYAHRHRRWDRL